jgi:hypothetical protein
MRQPSKTLLILCLYITCSSCGVESGTVEEMNYNVINLLDQIKKNNTTYIVVIPGAGCSGCVTEAEEFVQSHANSNKYYFIFTDYHSKKILGLKLGIDTNPKNMHFDELGLFSKARLYSLYPTVFKLNDKFEVISYEYLDPNNQDLLQKLS